MCNAAGQKTAGAILYILGLLVAGAMMFAVGAEFNNDDNDNQTFEIFFWIYACSLFLAAIGMVLEFGDAFCGADECKGLDYFGGLLTLVCIFSLAGFGLGMAIHYDDKKFFLTQPNSVKEISSMAWLSGVAGIALIIASLLVLKDLLCCTGEFRCDMLAIVQFTNMVLAVLLTLFWFLWADEQENTVQAHPTAYGPNDARDNCSIYSYLLGAVYLLFSLIGILKIVGVFY